MFLKYEVGMSGISKILSRYEQFCSHSAEITVIMTYLHTLYSIFALLCFFVFIYYVNPLKSMQTWCSKLTFLFLHLYITLSHFIHSLKITKNNKVSSSRFQIITFKCPYFDLILFFKFIAASPPV